MNVLTTKDFLLKLQIIFFPYNKEMNNKMNNQFLIGLLRVYKEINNLKSLSKKLRLKTFLKFFNYKYKH